MGFGIFLFDFTVSNNVVENVVCIVAVCVVVAVNVALNNDCNSFFAVVVSNLCACTDYAVLIVCNSNVVVAD